MAKHSKRSASIFRYPVLLAFSLFFVGLFALDLVTPDRAYSELENTTLSPSGPACPASRQTA